jgi:hypothetical protein
MAASKQDSAALAAAKERARRLLLAYRQVLGRDGQRTPAQEIVWRDMEARGYKRRTTMVADKAGRICSKRMAQAEGCRIFHLQTEEFITRASESDEPKPTPQARTE